MSVFEEHDDGSLSQEIVSNNNSYSSLTHHSKLKQQLDEQEQQFKQQLEEQRKIIKQELAEERMRSQKQIEHDIQLLNRSEGAVASSELNSCPHLAEGLFSEEQSEALAQVFHADGFVVLSELLSSDTMSTLHGIAMSHFKELQDLLVERGLPLGIGIKEGYKEIVQRHPHRFEMPYKMDCVEVETIVLGCKPLMDVVYAIVGADCHIVNKSLVISLPGAEDQAWHVDGGHISLTEDLPCHCLNVFLPLVDVEQQDGPTELRLGGHLLTRDLKKMFLRAFLTKKLRGTKAPCLPRGSALLFDYRCLHRGLANTSSRPRPVLVYTFAKPFFRDLLNFPHTSVFDDPMYAKKEI